MQDITEVPPGSKPYLSYQETPPKGIGLDNLVDDISHACLSQVSDDSDIPVIKYV
jgi:hypothetical protein